MKPLAIIADIDGTLAHRGDRSPYDWSRVGEDTLDVAVDNLLTMFMNGCADGGDWTELILVSGRDEVCRKETEEWLDRHKIEYHKLFMRPEGNNEDDRIIKQRIYEDEIKDKYEVLFVLDDRNKVVQMWRSLGLKCLQVAEGDF